MYEAVHAHPDGDATAARHAATAARHGYEGVVVRTRANRPALLVLADNYYDGWEVEVDGRPADLHRTNHTFRGVVVGGGEHLVVFRSRPDSLYAGLWISTGSLLLLGSHGLSLLGVRIRGRMAAGDE
jgi:uncharacterized membrane protein YfhO